MHIDALSVLCAQLTRDLLAIAKFLFEYATGEFVCISEPVAITDHFSSGFNRQNGLMTWKLSLP